MAAVSNRIRELREARGLSLQAFADLVGMTKSAAYRAETGATDLDLSTMRQISSKLGLKPSALLLDRDVEYRGGEIEEIVKGALSKLPAEDRELFAHLVVDLTKLCRRASGKRDTVMLAGSSRQAHALAEVWNDLDDAARERALGFLQAVADIGTPARVKAAA